MDGKQNGPVASAWNANAFHAPVAWPGGSSDAASGPFVVSSSRGPA